jgi:predicted double-glycine peptidase
MALIGLSFWMAGGAPAHAAEPVRSLLEMRQENLVLQQWDLSCAAATLATILRYQFGEPVTERSVALGLIQREEYLANPDLVRIRQGFSLLDLKRYVDGLGYMGMGLGQMEYEDLLQRAPIIVPVNAYGYPHFVIFRGATENTVLLADPAFGNTTLSIEKFRDAWIRYSEFGRVGFIVTPTGAPAPPGELSPRALDFVMLRP